MLGFSPFFLHAKVMASPRFQERVIELCNLICEDSINSQYGSFRLVAMCQAWQIWGELFFLASGALGSYQLKKNQFFYDSA